MIRYLLSFIFFVNAVSLFAQESGSTPREIYLVRHAQVDLETPGLCFSGKAQKVHEQYDESPVVAFDPEPVRQQIDARYPAVYTSTLPRAIETAIRLFPDHDSIQASALFNEYDLSIVSVPILPLPYKLWTGVSRAVWFLHLNRHDETRSDAKQRMRQATDLLVEQSQKQRKIVLVAHGFLIADMRRELEKRGWEIIFSEGNKNLAVTKLVYSHS
ncbi:histidine phosphatase family protein [uncultured Sunxiuqinia sp.]|uniref:histidine phosphatase family protein n=1 Tax=uncultured Sunxiuqinia sp. TaxID=1573825 RepID=UPI002AA9447A|nr:histidine phosphatase family protein [uncultured Sunxiuqinia sp.]